MKKQVLILAISCVSSFAMAGSDYLINFLGGDYRSDYVPEVAATLGIPYTVEKADDNMHAKDKYVFERNITDKELLIARQKVADKVCPAPLPVTEPRVANNATEAWAYAGKAGGTGVWDDREPLEDIPGITKQFTEIAANFGLKAIFYPSYGFDHQHLSMTLYRPDHTMVPEICDFVVTKQSAGFKRSKPMDTAEYPAVDPMNVPAFSQTKDAVLPTCRVGKMRYPLTYTQIDKPLYDYMTQHKMPIVICKDADIEDDQTAYVELGMTERETRSLREDLIEPSINVLNALCPEPLDKPDIIEFDTIYDFYEAATKNNWAIDAGYSHLKTDEEVADYIKEKTQWGFTVVKINKADHEELGKAYSYFSRSGKFIGDMCRFSDRDKFEIAPWIYEFYPTK